MATAPLDPAAPSAAPSAASPAPNGLRLVARVGVARWTVLLAMPTVARLGREHPGASGEALDPVALHRVMEGLRAKAVGLRWYGGGTLSIDPSDLADAPAPEGDGVDAIAPSAAWYAIVEIAPVGPPLLRLMA